MSNSATYSEVYSDNELQNVIFYTNEIGIKYFNIVFLL